MRRFPMKFITPVFGSLALLLVAGCEDRDDDMTTPETMDPPGASANPVMPEQDRSALRPAPSAASPGMGGASSLSVDDTQRVSGTDLQPLGAGGHAGHAGHGGKKGH
jgi:hypothetical protein